jgi:hypothetical protein
MGVEGNWNGDRVRRTRLVNKSHSKTRTLGAAIEEWNSFLRTIKLIIWITVDREKKGPASSYQLPSVHRTAGRVHRCLTTYSTSPQTPNLVSTQVLPPMVSPSGALCATKDVASSSAFVVLFSLLSKHYSSSPSFSSLLWLLPIEPFSP